MSIPEDMEMEKIAEDELSKLQRQFRVMEIDRMSVMTSVQPILRVQRNMIRTLNNDLDKIMLELKLTKSTSNVMESAKARDKLVSLLKDHERCSTEVREHRSTIRELDFLLKQVQKEIKSLRTKGSGADEEYAKSLTDQTMISQLENRLSTAMKRFNTVNSENYKMRLEIDRLLRDRQSFNGVWKTQIKRLLDGKAAILELVEQAIAAYDQREEWCSKLDGMKERAAVDYRKHCLEVRELQRQLDHSMKLEEFLRTKGTVRLTAADAKAEAKRLEQQEEEMRTYNNYVNILDAIREFTGEGDVDKLILEFNRREEENYALFNYINEVNTELKNLHDNVRSLRTTIDDEHAKHQAKLSKQQDSIESLRATLDEKRQDTAKLREEYGRSDAVLNSLLQQIQQLAHASDCNSLPLLKLLGKSVTVNVSNARLYIKSLEKKITEIVEIIKIDEALQRAAEIKERTPPSSRRRRRPPPPPSPRAPLTPRPPAAPIQPRPQPAHA
ncbi:coiled-coil domain-containing protein 63-like [Cydia fagiglandana]|uniref:coiled-coil domain-containing protein 63-like n=1 Tax=Cydia fagiglandana TaxID=1458189 RepID=UPI002FEDF8BE